MGAKGDSGLLDEVKALRADMARVADDVRILRAELAEFRASAARSEVDAVTAIRRLWDDGLESGDAGDLDDVLDEIAASLPPSRPAM